MPCGILKWKDYDGDNNFNEFVKTFNGFVEVDIHTPENLYNHFGEFPLIFKNSEYDVNEVAGEYMVDLYDQLDKKKDKRMEKKLISSFKGDKVLIKSDRLKWLIEKGLIITKIHGSIACKEGQPFKKFEEKVSEERRKGDVNPDHAIIAEMWKLVGNSAFGRTGMDKSKFQETKYGDVSVYYNKIASSLFKDVNQYGDLFEVSSDKKKTKQNIPIQVSCSIYDDAKFLMSKFYYDCLDKFIDRSDFQMIEMDTDSNYMALTGEFRDLIKPEMREVFEAEKHLWFPRTDTPENKAFDKRKAGLFKIEFQGAGCVALAPKMYYVKGFDDYDKFSSKGIQKANNASVVNFENYKKIVLAEELQVDVLNRGLRVFHLNQIDKVSSDTKLGSAIYMYEQVKRGLTGKYSKRVVLEDGVSTVPLSI